MVWTGFWKYKKLPVKFQVSLKNFKLISVNKSLICRTRWLTKYKILVLLHLKRKLNKNIVISQLDRCKFKRRNKMIDVIKYKSKSIPSQNYIKIWRTKTKSKWLIWVYFFRNVFHLTSWMNVEQQSNSTKFLYVKTV